MRHPNPPGVSGPPRSVFLPYPELVVPGPHQGAWSVEDSRDQDWLPSNGATNKSAKKIWVPLEPGGEGVTRHELAHVRFSPERFPRVRYPLIFLQAVEDARINMGLAVIGLPFDFDHAQRAHVAHLTARDAKAGNIAATIVRAIASLGTNVAPITRSELEALPPRAAEWAIAWVDRTESRLARARGRAGGPVASFRVARKIARDLARDLERRGLVDKHFVVDGMGCCVVDDEGADDGDRWEGFGFGKGGYARMMERRRLAGTAGISVGHMKISRPPLAVRQASVLRAGLARRRCVTEGTRIARPDRLALDRAIFHRAGSGGGGTILVDTSGSMSLSSEDVEKLVRSAGGAAVVAIYSGRADEGELRVVARGDRRVESEFFEPFGSGNIVDLPALQWLSRQPVPRLWVSDGCVTGVGDEGCHKILEACVAVTKRAGIRRFETAKEAIAMLDGSEAAGQSAETPAMAF